MKNAEMTCGQTHRSRASGSVPELDRSTIAEMLGGEKGELEGELAGSKNAVLVHGGSLIFGYWVGD